jgi:hypothetical protein
MPSHCRGLSVLTLWLYLASAALAQPPQPPPELPPPAAIPEPPPVPVAPRVDGSMPSAFDRLNGDSGFNGFGGGPGTPRVDYRVTGFPSSSVIGQGTNLSELRQDFLVSAPLWHDGGDGVTARVRVRNELFDTNAILPDTLRRFPSELWSINFGLDYAHRFDNGWVVGVGGSFGSASNEPFHSIDEMTAGFHTFLRIPQGEHNAFLFTLNYSVTGELNIPIPGVAYIWQPNESFRANIGLPFQIMYRPIDDLTLDFSYMLLTNIHARATYRLAPCWRIYTGYDWENESYFLTDRPDVKDRFFSYDQRVTTGLVWEPRHNLSVELSGGFIFDRYYFQGMHSSDQHTDRIDLADGGFVSLRALLRW